MLRNSTINFLFFETKSMVKDFLYSSIYTPSTQFFNLCVIWNINKLPKTDNYTFLGIPFDESLSLKPIQSKLNSNLNVKLNS